MQRYSIIGGIILVIIGVGIAYFYFFSQSGSVAVVPAGSINLPSAGSGTPNLNGATSASGGQSAAPQVISPRLMKISAGPVVPGEAVVDIPAKDASSSPDVAVSFIERQSGNVYAYSKNMGTVTRTSNKTIPSIESAVWLPDASLAFVRYLSGSDFSTINTYALFASGASGFFLPQGLADIAVSSTSVLSLASGVNGSVASLGRPDGSGASQLFTTPLSALRISFAGKNQYLAFTKPSSALLGYAFLVDKAGHFSRLAGPLNGLVALASPSGKYALVSYTAKGAMQMELVNAATGEMTNLPVVTIADKCTWSADESNIYCGIPVDPPAGYQYPDDWYQGAAAFSDRLWKIDVAGRFAQLVLDFSATANAQLDVEALAVNPSQTTLIFVNKNDGSLWSYQL